MKEFMLYMGFESRNYPGTLDHGKVWSTIVLIWLMTVYTLGITVGLGIAMICVSAAYGSGMWRKFLESKTVAVSEKVEKTEVTIKNLLDNHKQDPGA